MIRPTLTKEWRIDKSDIFELENNIDNSLLTEDMFQISQENYTIDSGWYQGQNTFMTYLISESNWEDPIIKIKSTNLQDCYNAIQIAAIYADKLIKQEIV
jgi:hypothetical protein